MPERETTVRSRELAEGLRVVLERTGLTGKDLARQLGWSQSDVSRLLTGKRSIREVDVARLLGACRVKSKEYDRLLNLCREANTPGWWQQHGSRLPTELLTYIDHEDKAIAIGDYQSTIMPGSLQTGDYARSLISRIVNVPGEEVDVRVAARLARQNIFGRRTPARFTFFLHEFVLRLPVGGQAVMSEQLHHLLRMSVRPKISLRVVPADIGAHAGWQARSYSRSLQRSSRSCTWKTRHPHRFWRLPRRLPPTSTFWQAWRIPRSMRDNPGS